MGDEKRDIASEQTRDMTPEQRAELQKRIGGMTQEELERFRSSFDPDSMGFYGEESV